MTVQQSQTHDLLIIEDDEDDVLILQHANRLCGNVFSISHYYPSGSMDDIADHIIKNHHPQQMILLDLNLPGINGHDILKAVRNRKDGKNIVIIVFTTSKDPVSVQKSYKLFANAHVNKPDSLEGNRELMKSLRGFWKQFCSTDSL